MNAKLIEEVFSFLEKSESESLELLKEIVNTDSYSKNKEGVDLVGQLLYSKLEKEGITLKTLKNEIYGDHIIAKIPGNKKGKILLVGHRDTAHPTGSVKDNPFRQEENLLRGPGVSDMKSGLVYMVYTAIALKRYASNNICDIELLFTPEEEVGSPITREVIKDYAKNALVVFNLEPARPDGTVVTSRKGSAHLKIRIEGKAAHSGAFIDDGISANDELARKMIEIKKLADPEKGVTVNFGLIEGGISNNIVSPHARGTIHCAFWKEQDFDDLYGRIQSIVNYSYVCGTKSTLFGGIGMLPVEKNEKNRQLLNVYVETARDMGLKIIGRSTMGASDAGFTSSLGIPTICGVGPVGGNWHAKNEYMELNTYLPRLRLLAASVLRCVEKYC